MRERPIVVAESDERRLRGLLSARSEASLRDQVHLQELRSELDRAQIVRAEDVPADVITLHSQVCVRDLADRRRSEFTLVLPYEADLKAKRISVLAPLGTALLGFRKGDDVEWAMPGGRRRMRVVRVRQPPASGAEKAMSMTPLSLGPMAAAMT